MSDIKEAVLKTLQNLDSPENAITCSEVGQRLRDAISMERQEAFVSLPLKVQAELIAFQAAELPQGKLCILSLPDSVPLQTLQTFVDYWSSRTISARSWPMRERYATIAAQVSETRSLKVNRFQIGKIQIEAAIETAVKCKPSVWSETMSPLKRALRLALSLRLNDLAVKAAEAMVALAEKCWSNEVREVNLWPQCFDAILVEQEGKETVSEECRKRLVAQVEAAFQATLDSISGGIGEAFITLISDVKRLVDFYRREKRSYDIDRVVTSLQQATLNGCEKLSPMRIAMCVQPIVQFLQGNGFPKLADEIAAKMLICSNSFPGVMQERRFAMVVPLMEIRQESEEICTLETFAAIRRLVLQRVPPRPSVQGSSLPVADIAYIQTIDESGRVTSSPGSTEEAGEQKILVSYCRALRVDCSILGFQLDEIVSRKGITGEVLAGFCVSSRAFSMDRREALRRGFAAWLHRDYAAAILFLLPQIERAVQRIVQDAGRSSLQPSKGNPAMDYKLLDGLLTDPATVSKLGEPCAYYLRAILTHRAGCNVRNHVLHGWVDPCSLGQPVCDRVVHASLLLAAKTMGPDETAVP